MYLNIILEYYVELLCVADDGVAMNGGEWLVAVGRYDVLVVNVVCRLYGTGSLVLIFVKEKNCK